MIWKSRKNVEKERKLGKILSKIDENGSKLWKNCQKWQEVIKVDKKNHEKMLKNAWKWTEIIK